MRLIVQRRLVERIARFAAIHLAWFSLAAGAAAQSPAPERDSQHSKMAGMQTGMARLMDQMHPHSFVQEIEHHASSGTSAEPNSTPSPMLMTMKGDWMLMLHANAFVVDTQQLSSRLNAARYDQQREMAVARETSQTR